MTIAFGRGCAVAGLSSEMCFMLVRMPLRRKPGDVRSRNCRVGRRGEGSDQALIGAGSWARHSIKNTQRAGRTDPDRQDSYRRAKRRFQVAARAGSTFPLAWHLNVRTFLDGLAQRRWLLALRHCSVFDWLTPHIRPKNCAYSHGTILGKEPYLNSEARTRQRERE